MWLHISMAFAYRLIGSSNRQWSPASQSFTILRMLHSISDVFTEDQPARLQPTASKPASGSMFGKPWSIKPFIGRKTSPRQDAMQVIRISHAEAPGPSEAPPAACPDDPPSSSDPRQPPDGTQPAAAAEHTQRDHSQPAAGQEPDDLQASVSDRELQCHHQEVQRSTDSVHCTAEPSTSPAPGHPEGTTAVHGKGSLSAGSQCPVQQSAPQADGDSGHHTASMIASSGPNCNSAQHAREP